MRVLVDTNVMIDLLAHRQPFYEDAFALFSLADKGCIDAVVASLSYATTAYVLERAMTNKEVTQTLREFSSLVEIAAVDEKSVRKALAEDSRFDDIEDAMQHYTALQTSCNCIVTRNKKDFMQADIPVFTPAEFLSKYKF